MRTIEKQYQDPVEIIWLKAALSLGIRVERDDSVFAAWNGNGVLRIGTQKTLDPDDSLAQMILHEICHCLCEGPESLLKPDWGLRIDDSDQRVREHACLRLQAALADRYELRNFFAATTTFRRYYDSIPQQPLIDDGDPAVQIAAAGWDRAHTIPWTEPLNQALLATSQIAATVRNFCPPDSVWASDVAANAEALL